MKYTVNINEKKKEISVTLADGTKGTARCCPTDRFDLQTGIELALERAKVAKATAEKEREVKPTDMAMRMSATMLAKQLEKVLPKGNIIVAVGGGDSCLTAQGKAWLAKIAGVTEKGCNCHCESNDDAYKRGHYDGYNDGYDDGYAVGYAEAESDHDDGDYYTEDEIDEIKEAAYNDGYSDGHTDGYDEATEENMDENDIEEILDRVRDVLADVIIP